MFRLLLSCVKLTILGCALVTLVQYGLMHGSFVFSPKRVKSLGEKYSGLPVAESVAKLHRELQAVYGKHVIPPSSKGLIDYFETGVGKRAHGSDGAHWIPFAGGGMTGSLHLMHASFKEYLAIIGSPVRTVGVMGWMWLNQSCTVLEGGVERVTGFRSEQFEPGMHIRFSQFESSVVQLKPNTWLFCYGRGFTPTSMPFMLFGSFSRGDFPSVVQMLSIVLKSVAQETFYWLQDSVMHMIGLLRTPLEA